MRLISYKMRNDSGFAPNPFFGCLTLATCKSGIRRSSTRKKGDWIAGFGSKRMCGDKVGQERLIFLMEVTEEPLPVADYFSLYKFKRPILPKELEDSMEIAPRPRRGCGGNQQVQQNSVVDWRKVYGDNIYKPLCVEAQGTDDFEVLPNISHPRSEPEHKKRDILGKNVLISKTFYYFGGHYESDTGLILLPHSLRPNLARGQSGFGTITEGDPIPLIKYIQERFSTPGIYGRPYSWKSTHESWKKDENYIQP